MAPTLNQQPCVHYISTFDRDLKRTDYRYLLTTSPEFGKVRDVLKSRQIELKHENKYKQK